MQKWKNSWNWKYYENMSRAVFKKWLYIKGLENHADLESLKTHFLENHLKSKNKKKFMILEIGGGLGRVVDWFIKTYPNFFIDVIEVTNKYFKYLKRNYSGRKNISIIKTSIQEFKPHKKYDLVIWAWAGILEMRPEEKDMCLQSIKKIVKKNGLFVVELPEQIIGEKHKSSQKNGFGKVSENHGDLYFHLVSDGYLLKIAEKNNFRLIKKIKYKTKTKNSRKLFVFERI